MEMLHTTPLFEATASICHTANTRLQVILGEQRHRVERLIEPLAVDSDLGGEDGLTWAWEKLA